MNSKNHLLTNAVILQNNDGLWFVLDGILYTLINVYITKDNE